MISERTMDACMLRAGQKGEIPSVSLTEKISRIVPKKTDEWEEEIHRPVLFNAEWARKMLLIPHFKGDRQLRKDWVLYLSEIQLLGDFNYAFVQHVTAHVGEDREHMVRINGQNSCMAMLLVSEKLERAGIRHCVTHIHYKCKDAKALRHLYNTVDQALARLYNTKLIALLAEERCFEGVTVGKIAKVTSGMAFWKLQGGKDIGRDKRPDPREAAQLVAGNAKIVRAILPYMKIPAGQKSKYMYRRGTIAAVAATYEADPVNYRNFWDPVATGVGFKSQSDPRLRLMNFQINSLVDPARILRRGEKSVDESILFRACIMSWNAWKKREEITSFRVPRETPEIEK